MDPDLFLAQDWLLYGDVEAFVEGYLKTLIFTSQVDFLALGEGTPSQDEPLDQYCDTDDVDETSRLLVQRLCCAFLLAAAEPLKQAIEQAHGSYSWSDAGGDFWLSSAGHGTGFWDRAALDGTLDDPGGPTLGDMLTELCRHKENYVCPYLENGDVKIQISGPVYSYETDEQKAARERRTLQQTPTPSLPANAPARRL